MFWPFVEILGELTYCPLADFGKQNLREGKDIYGKAVVAQPLTAHLPLQNAAQANGKIVVVERGQCDFVAKVLHAQAAGAVAVLVANSCREEPNEAFVMDAGRRGEHEISSIRIPALMISYAKASLLFEQLRESFLDRRELSLTIKFLGAQTAAYVLEQIEHSAKEQQQQEHEILVQQEREQQQKEAAEMLRRRLGRTQDVDGSSIPSSTASSVSIASSDLNEPVEQGPTAPLRLHQTMSLEDSLETLSMASKTSHMFNDAHTSTALKLNHWCPMTTAVLVVDVQNYFALAQNEKSLGPQSTVNLDFYKRIKTLMVPNIQDVLLASRACEGIEIIFSVVESATTDGRERSRAHKHAGIHVAKGGYGAQVLSRVAPTESDIVIPRTAINIFESTNLDYVLRNLGVSHLVLAGISMLQTIQVCTQTALDRGYQITLLRDAITADGMGELEEMLHHCEKLGCQVTTAAAFVAELQGYAAESNNANM